MKKTVLHGALLASAFLSGCAPIISGAMNAGIDEGAIQEKTAKHFGLPKDQIVISSVQKSALSTTFQATAAGMLHNCSVYYGEVECKAVRAVATTQAPSASAVVSAAPAVQAPRSMSHAQAQSRLNQLGYSVGTVDGIFGKRSVEKLKMFQRAQGLPVTGELDAATVEALAGG